MKVIGHHKWGAIKEVLLRLYQVIPNTKQNRFWMQIASQQALYEQAQYTAFYVSLISFLFAIACENIFSWLNIFQTIYAPKHTYLIKPTLSNIFNDFTTIFTDGSKINSKTDAAVIFDAEVVSRKTQVFSPLKYSVS